LVQQVAMVDRPTAKTALESCDWEVKTAIMTTRLGISPHEARDRLRLSAGRLTVALGEIQSA
jgi:N-acetylmuramic acid 6-phosphate (MurNAc-6-P) etherase